ncbi:hypothetical protein LTS08_007430 [Lithohypha guttulata]|nr:hypothetical protein LTS08_007430 [Lithohypha guttulata]
METTTIDDLQTSAGGETRLASRWLGTSLRLNVIQAHVVPNSCQWLCRTSLWSLWRGGGLSDPLLIAGPLGSGKSSLARFVVEELEAKSSCPILHFSFNAAQDPTFCTPQACLISILAQIVLCGRGATNSATRNILKHPQALYQTVWQCPYTELEKLVEKFIELCPGCHLVIDGLEDCTNQRSLYQFLKKLSAETNVSVVATCRNVTSLTACNDFTIDLEYHLEERLQDLEAVVRQEVEKHMDPQLDEYAEFRQEIIDTIVVRSQNSFLHAKSLASLLHGRSTPREIKEAIENAGSDHTAYYARLLQISEERLKYSPSKLQRRQDIFRLLTAANEPLTLEQMNELMAMNDDTLVSNKDDFILNIAKEIEELCGPFVTISSSHRVTFFHATAKTFFAEHFQTAADEANLYLARKCLSVLSQPSYRNPETAAKLLRRHLMPPEPNSTSLDDDSASPAYQYAALYFYRHIEKLSFPPSDVVSRLGRFLRGTESVTWSELTFDLKPGNGYGTQIDTRASLSKWVATLPPADQQDIQIDQYFVTAHTLLSQILGDNSDNGILQYLPRIRLGEFLNAAGQSKKDWENAYQQKQMVFDGLSALLPEKNPFLLQAKASLLQEYFWQKRYPEALQELRRLRELQREDDRISPDARFGTAWMIAGALVALGEYPEAKEIILETLEQVRKLYSEKYRFFNILLLLDGTRLERINDLPKAAATYSAALETMMDISGPENTFVYILRTALGAVQRKRGEFVLAEENLLGGWGGRQIISSIDVNVCLDAALQLAALYRDRGDTPECLGLLDSVHRSTVFEDDFERYCQLVHVRNLALFEEGNYAAAKHALIELINSATGKDREKNNRELLWIRIDLADAMRQHGDEAGEALMLFSELVIPITPTDMQDEPETPAQLEIAERALRLVRKAQFAESGDLLQREGLRWLRPADFYFLIQGGPALDTSIIAPVKIGEARQIA